MNRCCGQTVRRHLVTFIRKEGNVVDRHRADLRRKHVKQKVAVGRRRTGENLKLFPVRRREPAEILTRYKKAVEGDGVLYAVDHLFAHPVIEHVIRNYYADWAHPEPKAITWRSLASA